MKNVLILILYFFTTQLSLAQSGVEAQVLAIEKARFEAMVDEDFDLLDQRISDDLVYIHSNGNVDSKASFINAIKEGKSSYDQITLEESKVRVYEHTAIINGVCTFDQKNPDGSPRKIQLRYTNVYVMQNGDWKMVSWQSYKISQQG